MGNVEGVHDYQLDINVKIIFMGKRCVTSNGGTVFPFGLMKML